MLSAAKSYDLAGNRTREQIDPGVTTSVFNNVNQLTSQSPGGPMQFTGTVNEPSTVTLAGHAASVDGSGNWQGTANVTAGTSNSIALVATDVNGNVTNKTIGITVSSGSSRTPTYDADGAMTYNGAGQTYAFDAANRLTKITYADNSSTEFTYDGLGQRVKIVEKNTSGTVTSEKHFVWCPGDAQPCEERDASNNVTKRFYAQGEQISGTSFFYTYDHLGSVREMTDITGAIRARYDYDPYGRTTKLSGDLDADFRFQGMYYHAPSGLYLTWHRAYDPVLGRWTQPDPIGEAGGINLFQFVRNNPIDLSDPLGLLAPGQAPAGLGFPDRHVPTWLQAGSLGIRATPPGVSMEVLGGTIGIEHSLNNPRPDSGSYSMGNTYDAETVIYGSGTSKRGHVLTLDKSTLAWPFFLHAAQAETGVSRSLLSRHQSRQLPASFVRTKGIRGGL